MSCSDERRFDGSKSVSFCSGAGRLRSLEEIVTTDRVGEIGFCLKRLERRF